MQATRQQDGKIASNKRIAHIGLCAVLAIVGLAVAGAVLE